MLKGFTMHSTLKLTGVSSIILLLLLLTTDPQKLPSIALVVPFVLLFISLASGFGFLVGLFGVSKKSRLRFGLLAGAVPVILLVLGSLGQLTLRDVLVILALFVVAYFYMSRLGVRSAA
jgi:hypothetical protein